MNEQACQVEEVQILTIKDQERVEANEPLLKNDAFILYEDDDVNFVNELIKELPHYEFCKRSELLAGKFHHKSISELIEKRCRKLIIVISKNFLEKDRNLNEYLIDYTTAFQIGKYNWRSFFNLL